MDGGWIKLFRKFADWEWYQDSKTLHLFIHLLLHANHKPKKWRGVEVGRGQLICGRLRLSKITGISEQSIRTALERLKSTSEITIKSTNTRSIVTICNYNTYQIDSDAANQPINRQTNKQSTNNQPQLRSKEVKKLKKEIKNKDIYGELQNVELQKDEYEKLQIRFGDKGLNERIERLSLYIASKGVKYKSHYATIRVWAAKDPPIPPDPDTCRICKKHTSEGIGMITPDELGMICRPCKKNEEKKNETTIPAQ